MAGPHGLFARNFPAPLREFVEVDYLHKLNDSEREWLAKFNDEEAGCFRKNPINRSVEQRREIWREVKARKQDVMGLAVLSRTDGMHSAWDGLEAPEQDWRVPAADLLHQNAVAGLLAALPSTPKDRRFRVKASLAHRSAVTRLVDINQRQLAQLKR